MHPIVEDFLERPTSHKVGFWVASLALVGFIIWQYFYGPVQTELTELEEKKVTLNTQILNERRLARQLPKFQEEVKALEVKLKLALQELPDEKDIPNLLRSVADLAKNSGLEVSLFRPEPEVQREFFTEVPVAMTVDGTYHQIASFFDEVGRMERIVNIRGIDIKEPKQTEKGLLVKAECIATTFRYLPEAERLKAEESADNKKRRR